MKKWYRMPRVKFFLLAAAHILAAAGVLCILWATRYPMLIQELCSADAAKTYEESNAFANAVANANYHILDEIQYQTLYDTDGKYDPDKIVDVAKYEDTGGITGKDETGLSFRLGDMYSWGKLIAETMTDDGSVSDTRDEQDAIIVCQRSDGSYHYFRYKEFKQMIDRGDLSFVITGNSSADDILDELKQGEYQESSSGESRFRGLQDIDGKIAYINCWNYDGTKIPGDYKTVNGETVLQLVNNSKIWNGRLSDAYRMINDAAEIIYSDVDNYVLNQKQYQEGNTNITYLYVNRDNGTVITNKKKYQDYDHYEESLEQIKKSGKYVIVRPKLADYESNIEKAGKGDSMAQEWQKTVAGYVNASDYVYASVVDTAYPVKDDFYEQKQIFTQYAAGAKAAGIGAVLAVAAYLAILVLLTIGAGRSAEDEEVHLVKFDHIKTEPAAVGVILLWAVVMLVVTKAGIFTWQSVNGETIYTENKQIYLQGMAVGCLGALYSCAMFLLGLSESGEKNQGEDCMEEQCIQMAVTLFERDASKHPVSVENDDRISSIFTVPLADLYICCRWKYYLGVGIHLAGNRCRSIRLDGSKGKRNRKDHDRDREDCRWRSGVSDSGKWITGRAERDCRESKFYWRRTGNSTCKEYEKRTAEDRPHYECLA